MDADGIKIGIDQYYQRHFYELMEHGHLPNDIRKQDDYYYVTHINKLGSDTVESPIIALIPPSAFTK